MANRQMGTVRRCDCVICVQHPRSEDAREHAKINRLVATLDEKNARRVIGLLAERMGHGGIATMSAVTGMSRTTIGRGQAELKDADPLPADRVRAPGGGRPRMEKNSQESSSASSR